MAYDYGTTNHFVIRHPSMEAAVGKLSSCYPDPAAWSIVQRLVDS